MFLFLYFIKVLSSIDYMAGVGCRHICTYITLNCDKGFNTRFNFMFRLKSSFGGVCLQTTNIQLYRLQPPKMTSLYITEFCVFWVQNYQLTYPLCSKSTPKVYLMWLKKFSLPWLLKWFRGSESDFTKMTPKMLEILKWPKVCKLWI